MTEPPRPGQQPWGFHVQFTAFDKSACMFSSTDLGSWATESRERALDRLRLFVQNALIPMGETAALSAVRWAKDRGTARTMRQVLDAGGMYVHVIADGTTFYEISARPLVFPACDEDRTETWSEHESATGGELTGAWSP